MAFSPKYIKQEDIQRSRGRVGKERSRFFIMRYVCAVGTEPSVRRRHSHAIIQRSEAISKEPTWSCLGCCVPISIGLDNQTVSILLATVLL